MNKVRRILITTALIFFIDIDSIFTQVYTRSELNNQDFYINSTNYSIEELVSYIQSIEELNELDPSVLIWKAILYEEAGLFEYSIPTLKKAQVVSEKSKRNETFANAKMHELYFSLMLNTKEEFLQNLNQNRKQIQQYEIVNRAEAIIESLEIGCLNPDMWEKIRSGHISYGSFKYGVKPTIYLFRVHAHQSILRKCEDQATIFHESIKKEKYEHPGNKYLTILNDILEIDKKYRGNLNHQEALKSYISIFESLERTGFRPWIQFTVEYRIKLICEIHSDQVCNRKLIKQGMRDDYLFGSEKSYYREILKNNIRIM